MEGNAHVPDTCRECRRPVPTTSKVRGRSKVPALELENFTKKRTNSPARILRGREEIRETTITNNVDFHRYTIVRVKRRGAYVLRLESAQ